MLKTMKEVLADMNIQLPVEWFYFKRSSQGVGLFAVIRRPYVDGAGYIVPERYAGTVPR